MSWITDTEAEKALDWLRDNAARLGDARRSAAMAESMVKRIKAIEMKRSDASSAAAKEADALSSDAYLEAITADAEAAGRLEELRALRDAAAAKLDVWRTLRANERAMTK